MILLELRQVPYDDVMLPEAVNYRRPSPQPESLGMRQVYGRSDPASHEFSHQDLGCLEIGSSREVLDSWRGRCGQ